LLLIIELIVAAGIIGVAITRKASRDSYFGVAIAAAFIGFAFLSNISSPAQLLALTDEERIGAERLNALARPIAWTFFAVASGVAFAGVVRGRRGPNESGEDR
jgi:hypothetical protein